MTKLLWKQETVHEVAQLLVGARLEKSAAIGNATVYHVWDEGQEKIAVSLPDGQALVIELAGITAPRRRRRLDASGDHDKSALSGA
ncbi:hypothetical protein ACO0LB_04305 [Undibacterium sp. SXout7W]|uniref:hypothetical protein n=1 Tax=Undibacterium sp. SXout7W TaxID=3413049 RepID=UPI003BF31164